MEVIEVLRTVAEANTAAVEGLVDLRKKTSSIENRLDAWETRTNRPGAASYLLAGSGGEAPAPAWRDAKTRRPVPIFRHGEPVVGAADLKSDTPREALSVGRMLRGIVMGGAADDARQLADERKAMSISNDPSGGFTVGGILAGQWIDNLRAASVLSRAGAITVPMDSSSLSLIRVTGDPAVSWHGENDLIPGAEPTFGLVTLNPKTAVCLVKLSLELAQDAANIEESLQTVLTRAMAQSIDAAGLVGVTASAGAAPMTGAGIFNLTGRNSVTSIGAPTSWDWVLDGMYELMLDNVPADAIGALIAHPAVWKKMSRLKTGLSGDNTPLTAPAEVGKLPKLWTTAAPLSGSTAKGVIADWRQLLFGVRQSIEVRVLQESFLGSNLQLAILAYARVDFAAAMPKAFCSLEGITVS